MAIIAAAFLLCHHARAGRDLLDEIYARFDFIKSASADFTEVKKARAFKRLQIQKGSFFSTRDGRLKWEIKEPVASIFTISGSTARIVYPDLGYEKTYDLASDTSMGHVARSIFAIIGASGAGALKKDYEYEIEGSWKSWKEGWKVKLRPRSKEARKIIAGIEITITVKDFITSILIVESDGDSTYIHFTNIKLNPME